jgi:transposase-like protein
MIKWAEIDAEVTGYREGFVAIYRRHEGEMTDETDAVGRPIKVTMTSFARHFGIGDKTFRRWVREDGRGGHSSQANRDRLREESSAWRFIQID